MLAKSGGRQAKEIAIRRKRLVRLVRKLRVMRRVCPSAISYCCASARRRKKPAAPTVFEDPVPERLEAVTRETFSFQVDKKKFKAAELRDGHYLLR